MKHGVAILSFLCLNLATGAPPAVGAPQAPAGKAALALPAPDIVMHPEYAKAIGRYAYIWGWPMVNMQNRSDRITKAPRPGLLGGILPVAPRGQAGMLHDYIAPQETFVTCPNQDVVYGLGFFSLDEEPVIAQVPDFGDRFWVYALYDQRTNQFGELGKPYKSKPGFYLLVGPNWKGKRPAGVQGVIRSPTALANAIPRIFMDDTEQDRKAIQDKINQVVFYPLKDFDGKMKTINWKNTPDIPNPQAESASSGETRWVIPETFFDQLGKVLDTVPPLPGEEAMYAQFRSVLAAAARDPAIKEALLQTAKETEEQVIAPFFQWKHNGRPAGNNWNRSVNNAQTGLDYFNRTGTSKSNMFDNRPSETQYFYTDFDAAGAQLDGSQRYEITFPKGQLPPVKGFWSLTLYNKLHLFSPNELKRYSLGTKNKDLARNADGSIDSLCGTDLSWQGQGGQLAALAQRAHLALHTRVLGPAGHTRRQLEAAANQEDGLTARTGAAPVRPSSTSSCLARERSRTLTRSSFMRAQPRFKLLAAALLAAFCAGTSAAQEQAAISPLVRQINNGNWLDQKEAEGLRDELYYQRAIHAYMTMLPALNVIGMRDGSEKAFGAGYNVLPIWKERMDAKTMVPTPNADVIYSMSYLDLKKTGPLVVKAPPNVIGMFTDFFQRTITDVGAIGPDRARGGLYLLLPPDYDGHIPSSYFAFKSPTYNVFLFFRTVMAKGDGKPDPAPAVKAAETTRVYPLWAEEKNIKPMEFPDASGKRVDMMYPVDRQFWQKLKDFVDYEPVSAIDPELRGVLASIGIVKGQPFEPTQRQQDMLQKAVETAPRMILALRQLGREDGRNLYYKDRQWERAWAGGTAEWMQESYLDVNQRAGFFQYAYSSAPAMVMRTTGAGSKYPYTARDAAGNFLHGSNTYKLRLPPNAPAALFWAVTAYNVTDGTMPETRQLMPSTNGYYDIPKQADGSVEIWFGPDKPEGTADAAFIQTIPGRDFLVALRLYGAEDAFYDQTWKPDDIIKVK